MKKKLGILPDHQINLLYLSRSSLVNKSMYFMKSSIYIIKEWSLVNRSMYFMRSSTLFVSGTVPDPDEGPGTGAIIAAVVSSIFVVLFIIAVFFVRRRFQNKSPGHTPGGPSPRTSFSRHKKRFV